MSEDIRGHAEKSNENNDRMNNLFNIPYVGDYIYPENRPKSSLVPEDLKTILERLDIPLDVNEIKDKKTLINYLKRVIDAIAEGLNHYDPEKMAYLKSLGVPYQFDKHVWEDMNVYERLEILKANAGWLFHIFEKIVEEIKRIKSENNPEQKYDYLNLENFKSQDKVEIVAYAINTLNLLTFVTIWYADNSRLIGVNDRGLLIEDAEDILNRYANTLFGSWISRFVKGELKDIINTKDISIKEIEENSRRYIRVNNAIIDLETLDVLEPNNDIVFMSKMDIDIEPTVIHRIKNYSIIELEQYFKDNWFERTFRRFYDDENWEKLRRILGSIYSDAAKIIAVIYGDPDTLKTTLINILFNALNPIIFKISISDIGEKPFPLFGITHGTRCIVDSEFSNAILTPKTIEKLKSLVGGDILKVERKHRPPLIIKENTLKAITSTNTLPTFTTIDKAILERLYLIPTQLPEEFKPNPDIRPEIEVNRNKKLREEIFYYLLFCYRLYKENPQRLRELQDIEEIREILIEEQYPLQQWEKNRIEKIENAKETLTDLWNDFIEWRKTQTDTKILDKINQINRDKFKRLLEARYQKIIHGQIFFKGIRLKNKTTSLTS
jgi:hypothetical protein